MSAPLRGAVTSSGGICKYTTAANAVEIPVIKSNYYCFNKEKVIFSYQAYRYGVYRFFHLLIY